ncbi:MAG TPA: hypothetical protein VKT29_16285 [Terriglobales bacterium]|nr:hypothetical protein [Terriglobales bacterium]
MLFEALFAFEWRTRPPRFPLKCRKSPAQIGLLRAFLPGKSGFSAIPPSGSFYIRSIKITLLSCSRFPLLPGKALQFIAVEQLTTARQAGSLASQLITLAASAPAGVRIATPDLSSRER